MTTSAANSANNVRPDLDDLVDRIGRSKQLVGDVVSQHRHGPGLLQVHPAQRLPRGDGELGSLRLNSESRRLREFKNIAEKFL